MSDITKSDPLKQYITALTSEQELDAKTKAQALLKQAEQMHFDQALGQQPEHLNDRPNDLFTTELETTSETRVLYEVPDKDVSARFENEFFALILEFGGMKIAMPLVELGGIHRVERLSKVPSKSKYDMGVLVKNNEKYTCIDLAKVIMPRRAANNAALSPNYEYAVQLEKTSFVVACEAVSDTTRIEKADVKWRESKTTHLWNAGTVTSLMCVLIDVKGLLNVIERSPN
ncbi:MAG: chemotaxis protein CheW [Pseudomonadota bacterium]